MGEARTNAVRLIIVDESMLENLAKALPQLREAFPMASIALAFRNTEIARNLVVRLQTDASWGQVGFLPMNINLDFWLSVVRLLAAGECYFPAELFVRNQPVSEAPVQQEAQPDNARELHPCEAVHLTTRELQVLESAAEGKQNKIIADELQLSQHTVKLHMHHIIAKLGVHNRTEAANWYHRRNPDG
ncbi:helix-turn-helix transcriptional regulator [Litoreibacter albidus]|nr:response regulator transcription factor [Litoreibacter albidus]